MVMPRHPCLALTPIGSNGAQRSGSVENRLLVPERSSRMSVDEPFRKNATASIVLMPHRGGLPARKQKLVLDYIEQHLAEKVSRPVLASVVGLSPYHFARAFRTSFGVPPHRYHMGRRMNRARELLLCSTLPVTQIGVRIGFRETSSFTRAYRKYAGLAPSEFRRQLVD